MFNVKIIINNNILYKIYKNIRNSLNKEFISILYSSGMDSSFLLNLLTIIIGSNNIIIININHNISKIDKICKIKCLLISYIYKLKLFIINLNNKNNHNYIKENFLRIKREKLYKIFSKKFKIQTFWTGFNYNDKIETSFINIIKHINNNKKVYYYKNNSYLIQKKKPFKNIKKNYIKSNFYNNYNWLEDYWNIKKKNIRNILRLDILYRVKFYKRCGWAV